MNCGICHALIPAEAAEDSWDADFGGYICDECYPTAFDGDEWYHPAPFDAYPDDPFVTDEEYV